MGATLREYVVHLWYFFYNCAVEMVYRLLDYVSGCDPLTAVLPHVRVDPGHACLVTGGSSGVGLEVATELARLGYRVLLTSRSEERGRAAAMQIRRATGNSNVEHAVLDLGSPASVRTFSKQVTDARHAIQLLILNAGAYRDAATTTSQQALDPTIRSNHLGHFYLTMLLLGSLASPPRVVTLTSVGHALAHHATDLLLTGRNRFGYDATTVYAASKLGNLLFAQRLARQATGYSVTSVAVHPGLVDTAFYERAPPLFRPIWALTRWVVAKSAKQGARSVLYAALAPDLPNGCYISDCRLSATAPCARNHNLERRVWDASLELVSKLK